MAKQSSTKLTSIKIARGVVYLIYAYLIIATVFLFLGFLLLLLGANPSTPFVNYVYEVGSNFLQPFRGMFPPKQVTETSYFSSAALFAIVFYSIIAMFLHSLIDYITMKLEKNEYELKVAAKEAQASANTGRKPAPRQ